MRSPKRRMAATPATAQQLVQTLTLDRRPRAAMEAAMEAARLPEVAERASGRFESSLPLASLQFDRGFSLLSSLIGQGLSRLSRGLA